MFSKLDYAIRFATRAHHGQWRIDRSTPYIVHPLRVMTGLIQEFDLDSMMCEDVLCAAVLHDVIEDTETTYSDIENKFGNRVTELVGLLTKKSELDSKERNEELLKRLISARKDGLDQWARIIKLMDFYDNLCDLDISIFPTFARTFVKKRKDWIDVLPQYRIPSSFSTNVFNRFVNKIKAEIDRINANV